MLVDPFDSPDLELHVNSSPCTPRWRSQPSNDMTGGLAVDVIVAVDADFSSYYVGYAKFFDASDNSCDQVSWHMWYNLFTKEYLTKARRQSMNDLVDLMNGALRSAVARAGSQVKFVEYDSYVSLTNGRYCAPGSDETSGNSANRGDLFFYEMKSQDTAWMDGKDNYPNEQLQRRQDSGDGAGDEQPVNNTLNA